MALRPSRRRGGHRQDNLARRRTLHLPHDIRGAVRHDGGMQIRSGGDAFRRIRLGAPGQVGPVLPGVRQRNLPVHEPRRIPRRVHRLHGQEGMRLRGHGQVFLRHSEGAQADNRTLAEGQGWQILQRQVQERQVAQCQIEIRQIQEREASR